MRLRADVALDGLIEQVKDSARKIRYFANSGMQTPNTTDISKLMKIANDLELAVQAAEEAR